jgi:hypothetical protein
MAGTTRLELATSAVTGQRSNQLNYVPAVRNNDLAKNLRNPHIAVCEFCMTLVRRTVPETAGCAWPASIFLIASAKSEQSSKIVMVENEPCGVL